MTTQTEPKRMGRPPKSGETMRVRPVRMTDSQWEDAKHVGWDAIRDFVTREAAKKRRVGA